MNNQSSFQYFSAFFSKSLLNRKLKRTFKLEVMIWKRIWKIIYLTLIIRSAFAMKPFAAFAGVSFLSFTLLIWTQPLLLKQKMQTSPEPDNITSFFCFVFLNQSCLVKRLFSLVEYKSPFPPLLQQAPTPVACKLSPCQRREKKQGGKRCCK